MDPDRWQRIEELVDAALDLPVDERATFVDASCGADSELKSRVAAWLAACQDPFLVPDEAATSFAAPFLQAEDGPSEPQRTPIAERIGAYRIVREIGRGGMGAVYLAERDDGEFEQRVALKLMRMEFSADPSLLGRFRNERQILARLQHPHIARLLDGGVTADGQPFFVMEHVDGQPIHRHCDDRHLPIDERLRLFLTACDAVAYAHRQSIVHRDLKPSNILVTSTGEVKLLDFGIATLMSDDGAAGLTRTGERLLTPEYASPEQVRGLQATAASDVHALGVLLFELLTGQRPFPRTRTADGVATAERTTTATPPSSVVTQPFASTAPGRTPVPEQLSRERRVTPEQLRRRLRGDLDAIVLQALRQDPAQRYATADHLADDVRRHLQGLPIHARGRSPMYRLRRFVRRHRVSVTAAVGGAIGGLALLTIVLAGTRERRAIDDRTRAETTVFHTSWIVVAPFENRTADPSLEQLGIMAAEWVAQALSRTGLVKVVDEQTTRDAASAVAAAAEDQPLHAIAQRTGAGTVISGSYYLDGDRVRFQGRITDAVSGQLLQSTDAVDAPRERPTEALEPLRQRITGALAALFDERLNTWTATASQPPLYAAYQEFLLGTAAFGTDPAVAIRHFARAAELDPMHWQAYLWEGQTRANDRDYRGADSVFNLLSQHRSQLPPYDLANLDYFHRGYIAGDWPGSYRGAQRMTELAPSAPHALFALGSAAAYMGRCGEAIDALERIDLDRGWGRTWSPRVLRLLARCMHEMSDHSRELDAALRLRDADPDVGWTRLAEVRALAALGKVTEVMQRVDEAMVFPSTSEAQTWEAFSPGNTLSEAARELAAHGHAAPAAQLRARAIAWYRDRPADEAATQRHMREFAAALYADDQLAEASALYRTLAAGNPGDVASRGMLAVLATRQDHRADADTLIALLEADTLPYQFGRTAYWLARVAALRGDRGHAVEMLRKAQREGYTRLRAIHAEPDFDALRDYPPFRQLVRPGSTP